jgi:uncharacterized protein involved in outer membrane biogenesis
MEIVMADTKIETKVPKRGRWLRRLGWIVGVLVVLVVALYFVATSSAFVKGVIVPRVGHAMNADISVGDAQVSPFKKVVLHDVKVTPKGAEPLFTATEVRLRYSLFSIIGGKIAVEEMTVIAPTVTIVEKADGTSNLDPLLKKKKPAKKSPPSKPGSPPSVDVKSVAINNATIRRVKNLKGGGRDVFELANVNVTTSNIKNGEAGKLDVAASLSIENAAKAASVGGSLHATLKGGFNFNLAKNLLPTSLKGDTTFAIEKATGELSELGTLTAKLDCDTTATEIKQFALRFTKANAALGEVRVSGPFDAAKAEGKFKVEILPLDRQVLNLAGAVSGLDFGTTTVKATSEVELTKGGHVISLAGNVDVARFQIIRQKQTSPTLDLRCDYNVTVNRDEQTVTLKTVNLAGTQNQRPFLKAELTSPMTIAQGKADVAVGDAALNIAVTDLQLTDWKTYAPEAAPEGKVNAKLKLLSQKGGSQLTFEIESQVENLSARFGSNQISRAEVRLVSHGQAVDLKQFKLADYRLELAQQGQAAVTVSGSGTFDKATQDADLQVVVQATVARLLALFPQPDARFTGGMLDFKGHVTSKKQNKEITGQLILADLTGNYGTYRFANFGTSVDVDVAMMGNATQIRKASGHVREGQNMGGKFELSGNYDLDRKAAQIKLKLADFNQNGLRPFLESALGDKKLVSVTVNSTASASFKSDGDATVKADFQLANLVVSDPKGGLPTTPLEARVQVDTAVSKKVAQVRQCQLTLSATNGAKNQLDLTGRVDFSKTNTTGNLKLAAESLDLTRYYDLFADKPTTPATKPGGTASQSAAAPAPSDKEPDPIKLPFQNFTCDVNIGRLRLREVDITKLQTTALIDGSHVVLKPCQLTLNGAPVAATADLDLSVPGYRYDVMFNAQAVPLTPLVNSLQPDRKGQIGGHVTASAQIKGEGTTGASLQKNLSGQFNVLATNLNLAIGNVHSPVLKTVINVVVAIPDLIRNPTGAVGNLLGKLTGTGGPSKGGWLDEFTSAPINVVLVQGDAGKGHVRLQQAEVRSTAFQAQADGDIAIAPILTNSTINIPVNIALSHSLGQKIGLGSADTNAAYVMLPQLVTLKGTLGKPKESINTVAVLSLAAKTGGGVVKQLGGTTGAQVGDLIQGVGNLLGGGKAAPATNPPAATATNASPAPNAPAATSAPPTNRAINLLDLFKKPKKE